MRPSRLEEFVGQQKAAGEGSLIRKALEKDHIFSMILWGPPGCGKTTLAKIIAAETKSHFIHFSAVLSGVKEIRAVIQEAKDKRILKRKNTILFVDEIHRFNKAQQDSFLHQVESGLITLIGATTENPSFEINAPLLSRCRVITMEPLSKESLKAIIIRALKNDSRGLGKMNMRLATDVIDYLAQISDGDARTALNNLEAVAALIQKNANRQAASDEQNSALPIINLEQAERLLNKKALLYDKSGEEHFNLISAFHKSLRGSDPDASLYWLARMISAGENPLYVARRMVRFASEDVGNADPHALTVAVNAKESYMFLGSPEGDLALAQAAIYLATAPKSNKVYSAYKRAVKTAQNEGALPVPLHIRNAPSKLMKNMGYGEGYKYAHDFRGGYAVQEYLPDKLIGTIFYEPTNRGYEKVIKQRLDKLRTIKKDKSAV
jgi:putative ATPase